MMHRALLGYTGLCALVTSGLAFAAADDPSCTPSAPAKAVGAWIETNDDGDGGDNNLNYWSPNSPFQALIQNDVYNSVDILSICWADTVPVATDTVPSTNDGASGWTLSFGSGVHPNGPTIPTAPPMPPGGYTNTDYFGWIVDAAQTANSKIKITVTLNAWDIDVLNRIFHDSTNPDATSAQSFASNVVAFLDHYQINGIDVDWETCFDQTTGCQDCIGSYYSNPSSDPQCPGTHGTSADMFVTVFTAIGSAFDTAEANDDSADYLLTLSPAMPGTFNNACGKTVSCYFDAVNLQLYYNPDLNDTYSDFGVHSSLFAYGACFENDCAMGMVTDGANEAFKDNNENYQYNQYMMWRLNSANWLYEQGQQQKLYEMVFPPAPPGDIDGDGDFDTDDITAAHDLLGTHPADLNFDGCIDGADLGQLLGAWGCP